MKRSDLFLDIVGGKFTETSQDKFDGEVATWKDCSTLVSVEEAGPKRSVAQLRYLFGVVYPPLMDHMGERNKLAMHETIKAEFLSEPYYIPDKNGVILREGRRVMSTRDITHERMAQMIDEVIQLCGELGIRIQSPEEYYKTIGMPDDERMS